MIIEFQAVDRAGQSVTDTVEATDVRSAMATLRKRDLIVTRLGQKNKPGENRRRASRVSPAESNVTAGGTPLIHLTPDDRQRLRLSGKQLTLFTRQMAMLLTAGSGVVPALASIARQFTKPKHVGMVRQLCADLEEGRPLSEALRQFPQVFGTAYSAIIAAGEASGTLAEMFTRLSKMVGKRRAMRNKVLGAMVYPALLVFLSTGIVNVLMFFVMPRFGDMFKTLGVDLPASTSALLGTANFARGNSLFVALAVLAGGGGLAALVASPAGRNWLMEAMNHLPLVRRLMRGLILGETFRVLGMLVESRVGLLDAIELVKGVTRSARFQKLYASMESEVTSGGDISRAMETSGMVPPYICHAVHTGEESGNLGGAMTYVADILDEDNSELLNTVTRLFEPTILIVMGLVVGGVAISLFLPMFDVTSAIH